MAETSGGGEGDMPTEYGEQGPNPYSKLRLNQLLNVEAFGCTVVTAEISDVPEIIRATTFIGLVSTDPRINFTCAFPGSWN